ncbi:MAG: GIY-YIG nuclease family protein [Bacteroidota bacterium]
MNSVYILFSEQLNRYYVGESCDVKDRIEKHNSGYYKNSFTSASNDWKLFFQIICESRVQARKVESHIKKMKSRKYIQDLKLYPEMVSKLKEKFK